jgi:hypothetical protein
LATRVLKNAYLSINSVNLSPHVASITTNFQIDTPEDTAMGDNAHSYLPGGLEANAFSVVFNSDDAAGAVSATLWAARGLTVPFEIRADAGAVAVTNPKYTGNCLYTGSTPVDGSVGETQLDSATFQGSTVVTRATA